MTIAERYSVIKDKIDLAKQKSPNPDDSVVFVAVSKQRNLEEILEAKAAGIQVFGENRVQELLPKAEALISYDVNFQLIGHLQTNKVRQIVDKVEMIQSLDSDRLAKEIEKRAAAIDKNIPVLVQVNMASEEQKYGFAPEDVLSFLKGVKQYPHLLVEGLMFIAPNFKDKEEARPYFKKTYDLFCEIKKMNLDGVNMRFLSMGMSGDYEIAVEEGANMVRIGSAVFADE